MAASAHGQVVQLLLAAASGDARVRQPAHERLQELENGLGAGFVPLLLEAYADASVEAQGRYLAILMCKNVVDRQWQNRGRCLTQLCVRALPMFYFGLVL
eukprot:s3732_g4.t1